MFKAFLRVFFSFFFTVTLFAQDSLLIGKKYREDQIYFNITYNNIINKSGELAQQGISIGLHSGFMRDISFNKKGSLAMGIGLGYAYDKYQSNLIYNADENMYAFAAETFNKSKIETHAIEIPIEFRYRTSTSTEYKFWRVYFGGKIAYNMFSKIVYRSDSKSTKEYTMPFISQLQYGPQLTIGYNAWNLYVFWNSKPLFENAPSIELIKLNEFQNFKFGFQIYMF